MDIDQVRKDFPALGRQRGGKPPIYFDNASMAMKPQAVIEAQKRYYELFPSCGGHGRSVHWFANEVEEEVWKARTALQRLINARSPDEIIFTKNTTEALNLVAHSFPLQRDDVVLTTDKEHNSNLCPWRNLEAKGLLRHEIVLSNDDNAFSLENLVDRIATGGVKLVSMVHTSNLDGYSIPAKEIIDLCHGHDIRVMLDGAQSVPHKPIDVQDLDVDFLAFSVHKMCGPTGVGVLYGKKELLDGLDCFIVGGDTVADTFWDQEPLYLDAPWRFEAGLQNYAGIIGAGTAAEYLMHIGLDNISHHEYELNSYLTEYLQGYEDIEIVGPQDARLRGGILTFFVKRLGLGDIGEQLDQRNNVMVRTGTFCVHSWFNAKKINRNLTATRVSLYLSNTLDECRVFLETLNDIMSETKDFPPAKIKVNA
jgi:cysteine desulfurase/selenocysteine lyase